MHSGPAGPLIAAWSVHTGNANSSEVIYCISAAVCPFTHRLFPRSASSIGGHARQAKREWCRMMASSQWSLPGLVQVAAPPKTHCCKSCSSCPRYSELYTVKVRTTRCGETWLLTRKVCCLLHSWGSSVFVCLPHSAIQRVRLCRPTAVRSGFHLEHTPTRIG